MPPRESPLIAVADFPLPLDRKDFDRAGTVSLRNWQLTRGRIERGHCEVAPAMTDRPHAPTLSFSTTQHPLCEKCKSAMMFACVERIDAELVERTFECRCGHTVTVQVPIAARYD